MKARLSYRLLSALLLAAVLFPLVPLPLRAGGLPLVAGMGVEVGGACWEMREEMRGYDFTVPRGAEEDGGDGPLPASADAEDLGQRFSYALQNPLGLQGLDRSYTPPFAPLRSPPQPGQKYIFTSWYNAGVLNNDWGMFRYDRIDEEWDDVNTGLEQSARVVNMIAVDPFTPTTMFIATDDGVYKTTDAMGACIWDKVLDVSSVKSIVAHPTISGTIYAGTSGLDDCPGTGENRARFYRSTDGGETWNVTCLPSSSGNYASDICVWSDPDGVEDDIIYAPSWPGYWATAGKAFWKSTNGGITFTKISDPIIVPCWRCDVEPTSDVVYMTGMTGYPWDTKLGLSTDQGQSWSYEEPVAGRVYWDIDVSPYAADNGQVWAVETSGDKHIWVADPPVTSSRWKSVTVEHKEPRVLDFGEPGEVWVAGIHRYLYLITETGDTWDVTWTTAPATC